MKKPSTGEKTSPGKSGEQSVRLSIGEWEAASTSTTPTLTQAGPVKQPTQTNRQDPKNKATDKTFTRTPISPKRCWPIGRVSEARACLNKGKLNLENSRNLKTEIKLGVTEALDRLYALVKEAEADLKKARTESDLKGPNDKVPKKSQTVTLEPPNTEQSGVTKILEEHSRLLLENNRRLQEIQGQIDLQKDQLEKVGTASYADIVAKKLPNRSTLHSVVVSSTDETETGEEVLDRIRRTVDAKEGWVRVERVRKARDRKIIMGFGSKEERKKVMDKIGKDGRNLSVEEVKNKDPRLFLRNVLSFNTDEDVLKAMRNQNSSVFRGLDAEDDRMEIRYRKRTRNPHTNHVILSVSPIIWRKVLDVGYVHIDLQQIRVEDQSPLVQCTRCLGYGHGKRFCQESVDLCSHCGGPHLRSECAEFVSNAPPTCKNCVRDKQEHTEHNAFSQECPIRGKWDTIARSTVAYC